MFKSFAEKLPVRAATGKGTVGEPDAPETVRWAVRLMLVGAAISTVFLLFGVIVTVSERNSLINALISWNKTQPKSKQLSLSQIHSYVTVSIVTIIIVGLVSIGLWLWMARTNSGGRNWARITASVLFALWTFYTYQSIGDTRGAATLIASTVIVLLIWLVGLASLFLLWRPASTRFYKSAPAR
ncbi:MAG TPA: hypothetical protein VNV62_28580 [Trebonia sp.]|jgi:hypothetical protein|nr:hypothetical protein [Trebonia sp.]